MTKTGLVTRITQATALSFAKNSSRYVVWDDGLKGFGLRVEASGRKSYIVRYRAHGGGRRGPLRQMTLGTFEVLSAAAARKTAEGVLALVKLGGDPAQDRLDKRQAPTIEDLLTFYLNDYAPSAGLRASTIRDARGVFARYVLPLWRTKRVAEIGVADARSLHGAMVAAGGKHQANRALACLSSAFTRAIENGWRTDNPFRLVRKSPADARTRILSEAEVARLLQTLNGYPDQDAADAIRMLLFTGARLNEVLKAPWSQFDLERGIWVKPSAHTKQKRVHRLLLSADSLAILRTRRASAPDGLYAFPGVSAEAPRQDLKRPWRHIKVAARLPEIRLHDLRRTLGSYMAMDGHSAAVVGATLGHTQASTTARYMAIAQDAQRQALELTARKFAALGAQANLLDARKF